MFVGSEVENHKFSYKAIVRTDKNYTLSSDLQHRAPGQEQDGGVLPQGRRGRRPVERALQQGEARRAQVCSQAGGVG